jgi:hypothetical protein
VIDKHIFKHNVGELSGIIMREESVEDDHSGVVINHLSIYPVVVEADFHYSPNVQAHSTLT